ncbi:class I SAM-dependent methyltransferase [Novipirellula artificiosorum]|uniref:Methyltransferase domain-containing protein n=1 Tax=Novipirellula artificiosorum TaxID=2528016 RepID=A0A5C6DWQ6_9BACT|nr:class I SAM-dependent methyltransferase [Novipirellula artificiosorum]TWU41853.1 hypothetical protein Poly41_01450 [Novipirellula artificiosorum]
MLETISIPRLPLRVDAHTRLIDEANDRVDRFTKNRRPPIDNFVISDFALVGSAIHWIVKERLMCGDAFCEWGSGFGVVAMISSIEGCDACGIEIEPDLIDQARRMADDFKIQVEFAEGSFLPDDRSQLHEILREVDNVDLDSASGYEALGKSIDQFDLVFAFPWPGEQAFFAKVFDEFASNGALLLTYNGINQLQLQRHICSATVN